MPEDEIATPPQPANEEQPQTRPETTPDDQPSSESKHEDAVETHEIKSGGTNSYMIAIVIAVLFAIGLIGLGIVVFGEDETQSNTNPTTQTSMQQNLPLDNAENNAVEEDVTAPVSNSDIDEEIQEIDAELAELSQDDFDDSELSDESLGL